MGCPSWYERLIQCAKRDRTARMDLAAIRRDRCLPRPLRASLDKLDAVLLLSDRDDRRRSPWHLAAIVSTHRLGWASRRRAVKEQDHPLHAVQIDQISAFLSELLRANEITSARCQRAATAWHVKAVELREPKLSTQESIGRFLKSAVGAGDNKRVRSVWCPS